MIDENLVSQQVRRIQSDLKLHPVTASEIEFYLVGADACLSFEGFWDEAALLLDREGISVFSMGKEDGAEQYEISLVRALDPLKSVRDTVKMKALITELASNYGIKADFAAKPFSDRPGSGLHIHIHLNDRLGRNVFFKDDVTISDPLKHSIGGMLEWLPDCMAVFAPEEVSYRRFVAGGNTPTTVSWGANNRTVAIRLPMAAHENKHIEHRVAGADANPAAVMAVILAAMHYGISNQCNPGEQIFGDASLPMYNLPHFPLSLDEARATFAASPRVLQYFEFPESLTR